MAVQNKNALHFYRPRLHHICLAVNKQSDHAFRTYTVVCVKRNLIFIHGLHIYTGQKLCVRVYMYRHCVQSKTAGVIEH